MVAMFNAPITYANEQDEVNRAVATIKAFRDMPEKSIPPEVLRHAQGVAIMTVYKAGFMVSGRGGTGVVVARTGKGWSGPSSDRDWWSGVRLSDRSRGNSVHFYSQ